MLFAQEIGTGGWVAIIAAGSTALVAVSGAAGTLIGIWWKNRREAHADSVKDYQAMYLTAQADRAEDKVAWRKEVHDLRDEYNADKLTLQVQLATKDKEHQQQRDNDAKRCDEKLDRLATQNLLHEREKGEMRADIRSLQAQLRHLEAHTGLSPIMPLPGIIVADIKGIVQIFDVQLTGFLGWNPDEVVGQNVTMLVSDDESAKYESGMRAVRDGTKQIDPIKPINAHAKHKDGKRLVPITIFLDGRMMKTLGLIVATIRERPGIIVPMKVGAT